MAGLVLALGVLAVVPPAVAAGTGTISVTMVDENGDPTPGMIQVISASGDYQPIQQQTSSTSMDLAPGAYGVVTLTPWGGMRCVGFERCDYYSVVTRTLLPDGSLTLQEGQQRNLELAAEFPATIAGTARPGSLLRLDWSSGMADMLDYLGGVGGTGFRPDVQWLRNGQAIEGATNETYTPVGADAGSKLSARLQYSGVALAQFQMLSGTLVEPRTTDAVSVSKVPVKAFLMLARPTVPATRQGVARVEVTSKGLVVTGKVTITMGSWTTTKALRNGGARVLLPQVKSGRYVVRAQYVGTRVYAPSKVKSKTLTVTKKG